MKEVYLERKQCVLGLHQHSCNFALVFIRSEKQALPGG